MVSNSLGPVSNECFRYFYQTVSLSDSKQYRIVGILGIGTPIIAPTAHDQIPHL